MINVYELILEVDNDPQASERERALTDWIWELVKDNEALQASNRQSGA